MAAPANRSDSGIQLEDGHLVGVFDPGAGDEEDREVGVVDNSNRHALPRFLSEETSGCPHHHDLGVNVFGGGDDGCGRVVSVDEAGTGLDSLRLEGGNYRRDPFLAPLFEVDRGLLLRGGVRGRVVEKRPANVVVEGVEESPRDSDHGHHRHFGGFAGEPRAEFGDGTCR